MRICDICKNQGVHYETYATINEGGNDYKLELCGSCYTELQHKRRHHEYLAYKETVEEVTGEKIKKKSWLEKYFGMFE